MIRATTPKHIFAFDMDPSLFSKMLITYEQDGCIVLEKTEDDMTFDTVTDSQTGDVIEYVAWVRLTQEETARFKPERAAPSRCGGKHSKVYVQVRVLTSAGESMASDPYQVDVFDVFNDEVLENEG